MCMTLQTKIFLILFIIAQNVTVWTLPVSGFRNCIPLWILFLIFVVLKYGNKIIFYKDFFSLDSYLTHFSFLNDSLNAQGQTLECTLPLDYRVLLKPENPFVRSRGLPTHFWLGVFLRKLI